MTHVATDLHGHTRFSDGRAEPEDYVHARAGLGVGPCGDRRCRVERHAATGRARGGAGRGATIRTAR